MIKAVLQLGETELFPLVEGGSVVLLVAGRVESTLSQKCLFDCPVALRVLFQTLLDGSRLGKHRLLQAAVKTLVSLSMVGLEEVLQTRVELLFYLFQSFFYLFNQAHRIIYESNEEPEIAAEEKFKGVLVQPPVRQQADVHHRLHLRAGH